MIPLLPAFCLLLVALPGAAAENLLADLPTLGLWYPPHAREQPLVVEGTIILDLSGAAGKNLAVLEIPLPASLQNGRDYLLEFDAQSSQAAALSVVYPEAAGEGERGGEPARPNSQRAEHASAFKRRRIAFSYAADTSLGRKVQLFFDRQALATGATWTFKDFSLTAP